MSTPPTPAQLSNSLVSQGLPALSPPFLASILTPNSNSQRLPPLQALTATAKHRLLSSDLATANLLSPTCASFPADLANVRTASRSLGSDIFAQVIDIEDLSRSKWEQIEALESERKGEMRKGREVIRVPPPAAEADEGSSAATQPLLPVAAVATENAFISNKKGTFRLLLQDCKGQKVFGFELKKVDKVAYPPLMGIGCKLLLKKGAKVARGVVLLEPGSCVVFGGKIEAADKAWRDEREEALRQRVKLEKEERDNAGGSSR